MAATPEAQNSKSGFDYLQSVSRIIFELGGSLVVHPISVLLEVLWPVRGLDTLQGVLEVGLANRGFFKFLLL